MTSDRTINISYEAECNRCGGHGEQEETNCLVCGGTGYVLITKKVTITVEPSPQRPIKTKFNQIQY